MVNIVSEIDTWENAVVGTYTENFLGKDSSDNLECYKHQLHGDRSTVELLRPKPVLFFFIKNINDFIQIFFSLIASRKYNSAFSCLDLLLFHNMSPFIVVLCVSCSTDARNFKKINKFAFTQKEILWQVFHNTCHVCCVWKIFCLHCSCSVNKELLPERK